MTEHSFVEGVRHNKLKGIDLEIPLVCADRRLGKWQRLSLMCLSQPREAARDDAAVPGDFDALVNKVIVHHHVSYWSHDGQPDQRDCFSKAGE